MRPGDDMDGLRSAGAEVCDPRSKARPARLAQPCAAFDGCRCDVYAGRPQYCREFECVTLKSVKAGRTAPAAALRLIRGARGRADKVLRLLRALGDTEERLSLGVRFRRLSQRLKGRELGEETADTYSQLTLAVHDLNLLLREAFYPGNSGPETKPKARRAGVALAFAALTLLAGAG